MANINKRIEDLERAMNLEDAGPVYVTIAAEDWDCLENPDFPDDEKEKIWEYYGLGSTFPPVKVYVGGASPDDWD